MDTLATERQIEAVTKDAHATERAVDSMLLQLVRGEQVHPHQFILFSQMGWSSRRIDDEVRRKRAALELLRQAGTAADREQAEADARNARREADEVSQVLKAQMAKLQAALQDAEAKAGEAARRAKHMAEQYKIAAGKLCPSWVRTQRDAERAAIKRSGEGQLVRDLEARVRLIEDLATTTNWDGIRAYCERQFPAALRKQKVSLHGTAVEVDRETFDAHRKELAAQLPELKEQLERAKRAYNASLAHADTIIEDYLESLIENMEGATHEE